MRFVAIKGGVQLSMQSLHRYRSRLVGNSTQSVNQARAVLLERGITVPQGKYRFATRLPDLLAADNGLSEQIRVLLVDMLSEWEGLEQKIAATDRELVAEAKQCEAACVRLQEVPGIGAQTATALVATVGDGRAFETVRDLAT